MMLMNCSILGTAPVSSKMKCSVLASTTLGAKRFGQPQRFDPRISRPGDLDQSEFTRDRLVLTKFPCPERQIDDAMDRHDALELMADLLQHMWRAARDDGDARQMLVMLGLGDCQALDVVAAAGKQPDDTRQHARLVVNQHRQRACFGALRLLGDEIGGTCGLLMGVHFSLVSEIAIMPAYFKF